MDRVEGNIRITDSHQRAILACNVVTTLGRDSLITAIASDTAPDWTYIAVGQGTTIPASADSYLYEEIYRDAISSAWSPQIGTVRLLLVVPPQSGNGDWFEVGIFDQADRRVSVSTAEGTAGWSSDGTLSQETSTVHQGAASIKCLMTSSGTLPFQNTTLSPVYGSHSFGTVDYLQFWYRSSVDPGTLTVRLGTDASNYYVWGWVPGTATGVYSLFHEQFTAGTAVGTPVLGSVAYFRITHPAVGSSLNEYLDYVSLFGTAGVLMARGTVSATKAYNTVRNVYYSVKIT